MLAGLVKVIDVELGLAKALIAVCRDEQEALKADDLSRLAAAVETKKKLSLELAAAELLRLECQATLDLKDRIEPAEAEARFGAEGASLAAKMEHLSQSLRQLWEINGTNDLLIKQSLAFVRRMLSALAPGEGQPGQQQAVFCRIV